MGRGLKERSRVAACNLEEIIAAHKAAGHLFFDPANMKLHETRISSRIYKGRGGVFIVAYDKTLDKERQGYSVLRFFRDCCFLRHVGRGPRRYRIARTAHADARRLANTI